MSSNLLTREQRDAYVEALLDCPIEGRAAQKIGVRSATVQRYLIWARVNDEDWYATYEAALESSTKVNVLDAMTERGVYGVDDIVLHQGAIVMVEGSDGPKPLTKKTFSDSLLKDLARANMPEKFGEKIDITNRGPGAGAIVVVATEGELVSMRTRLRAETAKREAEDAEKRK